VETILQAIGNVGFPIVVTTYLLVRIENKLKGLAACITSLAQAVDKINNTKRFLPSLKGAFFFKNKKFV